MRRGASLKTLPPVHPREPPVTASSATVASRLNASHAFTVSTLREGCINRNEKLMLSCAETVEDWTCLWKQKEKAVEIPGPGYGPMCHWWRRICCPQNLPVTGGIASPILRTEGFPLVETDGLNMDPSLGCKLADLHDKGQRQLKLAVVASKKEHGRSRALNRYCSVQIRG